MLISICFQPLTDFHRVHLNSMSTIFYIREIKMSIILDKKKFVYYTRRWRE
nr:MAG TPA: hypothetical protein [Caudoviricetes sp.]